ncbi:flagellar basal body P-ring formation chaperone FlgA [Hyphococcus sp.]|jgi:flagella basal body P-ring formation protein FlgA|uniref:flagellar basal body P-ring formation chaperone FlgA n=1 Tax=Hyphococcus sp. TaxID=2038636 RepID=UPI003D0DE54E
MKRIISALALFAACLAPASAQEQVAAVSPQAPRTENDLLMTSVMPVEQKPAAVSAAENLRAGTVLHASDLSLDSGDASALDLYVGAELKRSVYKGMKLSPKDVGPPTVVERNAIVQLEFVRGPLMIMTEGRALDAGAVGDRVRIMNLNSKIILTAVITGPNKAVTQ